MPLSPVKHKHNGHCTDVVVLTGINIPMVTEWLCCLTKSTENLAMHIAVVLLVDVVVVMVG